MSNYQGIFSGPISAYALQQLRDMQESVLPDTCTILEPLDIRTGGGGITRTWGTVATNQPCRCSYQWWRPGDEGYEITSREASLQRYYITLQYDSPVQEEHRIVVNSLTFEVEKVLSNALSWETVKRVQVFVLTE